MLTIQTVLFPTDDSAPAGAARTVAERFARRHGATLHTLRVEMVPPAGDLGGTTRPPADEVGEGGAVSARRRAPTAGGAILDYAAEVDADVIVMGTHGRSGFSHLVMGSTAEYVLRRAPCPVLTVGPEAAAEASGPVLAPVEFTSDSDVALEAAAALAEAAGVPLVALHVVEPIVMPAPYAVSIVALDTSEIAERVEGTLERWLEAHATGPVRAHVDVRQGRATDAILEAAAETGAGLIVQATHGRTGLSRMLLGSVAEAIARQAPCPVLTVRAGARGLTQPDDPAAATLPVPREDWAALFDALSARAAGAPHAVTVEVVSPDAEGVVYADARLLGVTYDGHDDAVEVMVAGGEHHVVRPFAVRSSAGPWALDAARDAAAPGPWTLDVVRADGARERIVVRPVGETVPA